MQIPKIIHQCWLSGETIPDQFQVWAARWRELHPDWEYHLWTHETAKPMLKDLGGVYDRAKLVVTQGDVARLELVHRFGGVYVDMDIEPIKPIDDLLGDFAAFATFESVPAGFVGGNHINQAVFGAVAGHPAIKEAMTALAKALAISDQVLWAVRTFTQTIKRRTDVAVFPEATFHPYTCPESQSNAHKGRPLQPYTYGIHWFAASWCDQAEQLGLFKYPDEPIDFSTTE